VKGKAHSVSAYTETTETMGYEGGARLVVEGQSSKGHIASRAGARV